MSCHFQDSSEDLSDLDTEETLVHNVSSDDSDSEGDETASLASSVAELSSGMLIGCFKEFDVSLCLYLIFILDRN